MLAEKARPYLGRAGLGDRMANDPKQLCCAVHDGVSAQCGFPPIGSRQARSLVPPITRFLRTQVSKYRVNRHLLLQSGVLGGFKVALENDPPCMTIGNPEETKRYYQQMYVQRIRILSEYTFLNTPL